MGVGRAVRLVPYVQQQRKHYRAKFLLGQSSISGDLEGDVDVHADLPIPTREQLDTAAKSLVGAITQTPPAHSAIWIDGKRAHERIRAGETVEMPTRVVDVHRIEILAYEFPEVELDVVCGSGTYIRTLGLDLAIAVGSVAVMSHLRRDGVGGFVRGDAISIERLRDEDLALLLLPPVMAVAHMRQVTVTDEESARLGNGLAIEFRGDSTEAAAITFGGLLRGIIVRHQDSWVPKRIFPVDSAN